MIPNRKERYPRTAKAILAVFVIVMVAGPSMLRSADRKTRSHFTATAGRSVEEGRRSLPVDAVSEPPETDSLQTQRNSESKVRKQRKSESKLRSEFKKRIEAEERLAQRQLEKRMAEEERLARRDLKDRLAEESRLAEKKRLAALARHTWLEELSNSNKSKKRRFLLAKWRLPFDKRGEYPGYLAYAEPSLLRFSDESAKGKGSPSLALPEFSMMTANQETLVVETRLSDAEIHRTELLRQVVVKLDPHTIVSGTIDRSIPRFEGDGARFETEETSGMALRPEEVLIFFENQRTEGNVRTIVPSFSPALPNSQPTVKSKAIYRVE